MLKEISDLKKCIIVGENKSRLNHGDCWQVSIIKTFKEKKLRTNNVMLRVDPTDGSVTNTIAAIIDWADISEGEMTDEQLNILI